MSAASRTFSLGTLTRASTYLVTNTTGKRWVINHIHFTKTVPGVEPTLNLVLCRGNRTAKLLPVNFAMARAYALNVLRAGQELCLEKNDYIQAFTDTTNVLDYVVSGEEQEVGT